MELGCSYAGCWGLVFAELVDAAHDIAYGLDAAERVVGDFDLEGLLDLASFDVYGYRRVGDATRKE